MSNYIGGDVEQITCNHPDLGDFRFEAKANEDWEIDRGGIRTNDDANGVTSSGEPIFQMNRVRWMAEGSIVVDFDEETDDSINKLAASPKVGDWTIKMISGVVLKGKGKPVGDIKPATNTALLKIKLSGGGTLQKIS